MGSLPLSSANADSPQAKPDPEFRRAAGQAKLAMQQQNWPEALRWWDVARTLSPDHAPAYIGIGNALRAEGKLDEAEKFVCTAVERFPHQEQIAILHASIANMRRDWQAAIPRWEAVRQRFPNNLAAYAGSLIAMRAAASPEGLEKFLLEAEAALDATRQRYADPIGCFRLELAIANARLDWLRSRKCAEKLIAFESPPTAQAFIALAQACWHLGDAAAAEEAAQHALATASTSTEAIIISAWASAERGDSEKTLQYYRQLAELHPNNARWSLKVVQLLNWIGQVDEAVSELDIICKRWPDAAQVKIFLKNFGPGSSLTRELAENALSDSEAEGDIFQALAATAPVEAEWKRPLVVASPKLDAQIVEMPGAQTAVLVFTGGADGMAMPLSIFDRYLAALNVTTIYLKDFNRLAYLAGIRSLGGYRETLAALRSLLENLGITRLTAIGNCDGASAAIRYGIELGADRILAFGPSTHFTDGSLSKLDQSRNFKQVRLAKTVAPEMTDLKPFLESATHHPQIEIFFKEEDTRENSHALRISHIQNVRLHPQKGVSHHSPPQRAALSTENFSDALRTWLGIAPDSGA